MRKLALIAVALAMLAGCNTVRGAGQDVQDAGGAISNQAAETQREM